MCACGVTGTTSGSTVRLNLKRPLYLGGVDPAEALSQNVGTSEGFVGCIAEVLFIFTSSLLNLYRVFCFCIKVMIVQVVECWTHAWKVVGLICSRSGGRLFFSKVNFLH